MISIFKIPDDLGVNSRGHLAAITVLNKHVVGVPRKSLGKYLAQPRNTNPVNSTKVFHRRVLSCFDDTDHGFVVLIEDRFIACRQQHIPKTKRRDEFRA